MLRARVLLMWEETENTNAIRLTVRTPITGGTSTWAGESNVMQAEATSAAQKDSVFCPHARAALACCISIAP